ncbi:ABC-type Fe3+/spermidine/putrescine transport system ATPase subunit [Angulomicrobium tetraedrale]|uniref:ABC-type Fe3+/spermidine/putrescine transport system ATPase subunit n=1 Tax=Ancylobacter tetraedralis TaxID=217068 RepID=A0A839Z5T6_9HYPH|nr:ABC transporter ATP-binding protein [Ancylobacter tetraedralis]MBB3770383.1 ABC-type Fe3+/spermidine/putrescine transport system ATPase subunit [Ancylobacter tetraedralis]
MNQLIIDGVTKQFGALKVLQSCDLTVERGSVVTLLGPSGCGKTTLLRSIAGFVTPDAGRIRVKGQDISRLPPNRRDVGYVFQNYALFPHLTCRDNIAYGLVVRRVPKAEIARRVSQALDLIALAAFADRYPKQLSGGQQQRVAIARALVLEPQVLLLDEPFNALDAQLRLSMQVELRKLIDRVGITSIFVTHDQQEAMALSDRVAIMRGGRIEQIGSPLEIYDRPRSCFVADFIGRANLMPTQVRAGRTEGPQAIAAALPDGPATLVARPENIDLTPGSGPGWPGKVTFLTALGPVIEYEVDCGFSVPVRAALPRHAGVETFEPGALVTARIRDEAAAVVLPGEPNHA